MKKTFNENRIFTINDPTAPRLSPDLAIEIGNLLGIKSGVDESLILLQLEFWIAISGVWKEGKKWYYISSRDIAEFFRIMSHSSVLRAINNLVSLRLVETGNFNKRRSDKTPWYTLNYEGLSQLKSITILKGNDWNRMNQPGAKCSRVVQDEPSLVQNVPDLFSNVPDLVQNVPTLQERYESNRDLSEKLKPEKENLFENFWKSYYPHDRRGPIGKARSYYDRLILTPKQHEQLMQSLKNYKLSKPYQDGCIVSAHRFVSEYENYTKLSKY